MVNTLIHPHMMQTIAATHFLHECVIGIEIATYDAYNQPILQYVPSYAPILCQFEPSAGTNANEDKGAYEIHVTGTYAVMLAIYVPTVQYTDIATVDGTRYDIVDIMHDPTRTFTMLGLERRNINNSSEQQNI